jgi:hypothetical protein
VTVSLTAVVSNQALNGGAGIDAARLQQTYLLPNRLFGANWSPHIGAYAIIFDVK